MSIGILLGRDGWNVCVWYVFLFDFWVVFVVCGIGGR